ncbi:MAG: hypothetical protein NC210_00310 [[Clostridium] fimetarium]|nr:hypothetical protein [Alistipes timonensis]MCM1404846.1 hypothetical protein [[Clostridium] fimetarium]
MFYNIFSRHNFRCGQKRSPGKDARMTIAGGYKIWQVAGQIKGFEIDDSGLI